MQHDARLVGKGGDRANKALARLSVIGEEAFDALAVGSNPGRLPQLDKLLTPLIEQFDNGFKIHSLQDLAKDGIGWV